MLIAGLDPRRPARPARGVVYRAARPARLRARPAAQPDVQPGTPSAWIGDRVAVASLGRPGPPPGGPSCLAVLYRAPPERSPAAKHAVPARRSGARRGRRRRCCSPPGVIAVGRRPAAPARPGVERLARARAARPAWRTPCWPMPGPADQQAGRAWTRSAPWSAHGTVVMHPAARLHADRARASPSRGGRLRVSRPRPFLAAAASAHGPRAAHRDRHRARPAHRPARQAGGPVGRRRQRAGPRPRAWPCARSGAAETSGPAGPAAGNPGHPGARQRAGRRPGRSALHVVRGDQGPRRRSATPPAGSRTPASQVTRPDLAPFAAARARW